MTTGDRLPSPLPADDLWKLPGVRIGAIRTGLHDGQQRVLIVAHAYGCSVAQFGGRPCPGCHVDEWRPPSYWGDCPHPEGPAVIELHRARMRCHDGVRRYQRPECLAEGYQLTRRAAVHAVQALLRSSRADVIRRTGFPKATLRRLFAAFLKALEGAYTARAPSMLALDGVQAQGPTYTVAAAPGAGGPIVELLEHHNPACLTVWLRQLDGGGLVKLFVIDASAGLRTAIKAFRPDAPIVLDKRHVLAWVLKALISVRTECNIGRRLESLIEDGRKVERLKAALETRLGALTPGQVELLLSQFSRFPQLAEAYCLKERFFAIYDLGNREDASLALEEWRKSVPPSLFGHFKGIVDQLRPRSSKSSKGTGWREEFLTYFDYRPRVTTAFAEACNRSVNSFVGDHRGRVSFPRLRAQILFAHGAISESFIQQLADQVARGESVHSSQNGRHHCRRSQPSISNRCSDRPYPPHLQRSR